MSQLAQGEVQEGTMKLRRVGTVRALAGGESAADRVADDPIKRHPRPLRPFQLLFEMVRASDQAHFRCELHEFTESYGYELQVFKNGDLISSDMFATREFAVRWADERREAFEKGEG